MTRLPTVELRHKKSKAVVIRNKSDYDPEVDTDWELASSRSTADAEQSARKAPAVEAAPAPPPVDPDEDWTKMRWPDARKFINAKTGTYPRNKKHATELMSGG